MMAYAQHSKVLNLEELPRSIQKGIQQINHENIERQEEIQAIYAVCWRHSFLLSTIESVDSNYILHLGKSFKWINLKVKAEDEVLLKKSSVDFFRMDSALIPSYFERNMSALLAYLNNNGYPMAKVYLDEVQIKKDGLSAQLIVDKGELIHIGDINILGSLKISMTYITALLDIRKGEPYCKEKIREIDEKLRKIRFLKLLKPTELKLTRSELDINLFLDHYNQNIFQGIVGFQNSEQTVFTGDLSMKLINSFQYGSELNFNWKGFGNGSQIADVEVNYPYILGWNIGLDYDLNFQKIDTNFLNVNQNFGIKYLFDWNHYISFGLNREVTTLISVPIDDIKATAQLPAQLDQKSVGYFQHYHFSTASDEMLFKKGWKLDFQNQIYNSTILQNARILEIDDANVNYSKAYDSLGQKQNVKLQLNLAYAMTHKYKHVLIPEIDMGMNSNTFLFTNETFLIGGMQRLRGFDERSIRTPNYWINKLAYQYYFQTSSSVELFVNEGLLWDTFKDAFQRYLGFGLGLHLGMEKGKLSMFYALGKNNTNPILIRNAKFHFGYIQYL